MIIEAGYDIVGLAAASVNRNSRTRRALWMIQMDEYLHLLTTTRITRDMALPVAAYIDEISAALRQSPIPVRYIALAYRATSPSIDSAWLGEIDERLTADGWLGDVELLGQVVFDRTGYSSTVPRFSFRDYIGLEHLPRAVSVLGPHDVGCECVACVHFEQMLIENRQRAEAATA
jgi:hypothetical protein